MEFAAAGESHVLGVGGLDVTGGHGPQERVGAGDPMVRPVTLPAIATIDAGSRRKSYSTTSALPGIARRSGSTIGSSTARMRRASWASGAGSALPERRVIAAGYLNRMLKI